MSLFPDEYPDELPDPPRSLSECCHLSESPDGVDLFTWRLVHSFAHTRSAVGVNSVAGLAGCKGRVAIAALMKAEQAGWLARVVPEPYEKDPPPLWLGRLTQRR